MELNLIFSFVQAAVLNWEEPVADAFQSEAYLTAEIRAFKHFGGVT